MIRYSLECDKGHTFDGWFRNSKAFDSQARRKLVTCPDCGTSDVSKAMMAPRVKSTKDGDDVPVSRTQSPDAPIARAKAELLSAMRKVREAVEANAEYVGPRFAEEARKMHYQETEERDIYGEASGADVKDLLDEGIAVHPLPVLPEDKN